MDLAKVVSCARPFAWNEGEWALGQGFAKPALRYHVVAYDYGIKSNILRKLASRGCRVTVVPAQTSAEQVLELRPRRRLSVERPGRSRALRLRDPRHPQIARRRSADLRHLPRPSAAGARGGAKTLKMKFGHHGANHPVQDVETGRVLITSQNHGFAVDAATLPASTKVTHVSLFDGSLQGFRFVDRPAFCFQGHPEASPGPHDVDYLFDRFVELLQPRARSRPRPCARRRLLDTPCRSAPTSTASSSSARVRS